ncbi:DUF2929 family protein [Virgibacillus kekensis]|uniref:DUF2929 family protein n=1 Tax=Virgibacillus kekensis TaxID=202261 RepID=A0ABV9DP22_9BACI
MRFVIPFIWALLISFVIAYVLTSMAGSTVDLFSTFVVAVILTLTAFILGEGILKDGTEQ